MISDGPVNYHDPYTSLTMPSAPQPLHPSGYSSSLNAKQASELYQKNLYNLQNKIMSDQQHSISHDLTLPMLPVSTNKSGKKIMGNDKNVNVSDNSFHARSTMPSNEF